MNPSATCLPIADILVFRYFVLYSTSCVIGVRRHGDTVINWEAIGAIGEVLAAMGVIATLIYFGLQIKRHSQQMRIQNLRGQALEAQQQAVFQASPHMLDVLEKCYDQDSVDLSFKEATLMESYFEMQFATIQANYELYIDQLLDEKTWQRQLTAMAMLLSSTWMKLYWDQIKGFGDLTAMIDRKLAEHDPSEYLRYMRNTNPSDVDGDA